MSPELALRNLGLYSLQVAILAIVAGLLPWIARLRAPSPQLAFWYAVLAICIVLPAVQPWAQPPVHSGGEVTFTTTALLPSTGEPQSLWLAWWPGWASAALIVLGAGAAIHFAMLALGLLRLSRLRRRAEPVADLPAIERATAATATAANFYWSESVAGPVTFGYRDPVVIVPPSFFDLAPPEQESVAIHELLHVQRRDWLYTIAEECVRAALWFHPGIWFLLNRVQLAREQAVDERVVAHTRASDEYVGALLKIAAARIEPDLAPAPLFLKRRHLRERVAAIVQGVHMSKPRLTVTMIAVLAALPLVAGLLAWQIPLEAAPQEVRDAEGVLVSRGNFKVLHRTGVDYPAELRAKGVAGDVTVALTLNANGDVVDAKVVSGRTELRKYVLESVLNWHFSTDIPQSFEVTVRFQSDTLLAPVAKEPVAAGPPRRAMVVDRVDVSRLPAELQSRTQSALAAHTGDTVTPERMAEINRKLADLDSHLRMRGAVKNDQSAMDLVVTLFDQPTATPQAENAPPSRIRVGGNVQAVSLIQKVTPQYPLEAKEARVQGVVKLQAVIGKDGAVKELELVSGDPLLVPSAMEAVKQWVYRPTLLNGNPVEVVTQIDVNFTLAP